MHILNCDIQIIKLAHCMITVIPFCNGRRVCSLLSVRPASDLEN